MYSLNLKTGETLKENEKQKEMYRQKNGLSWEIPFESSKPVFLI